MAILQSPELKKYNLGNTTNLKDLPDMPELNRFEELNHPDQLAVRLRTDGRSYKSISDMLYREFEIVRDEETIRGWFSASPTKSGRLLEPYAEYKRMLAAEASDQATNLIRRAQPKAAAALIGLLDSPNDQVVHRASVSVLGAVLEAPRVVDEADDAAPASEGLMREIERERDIIRLGEEALATHELRKDVEESNG